VYPEKASDVEAEDRRGKASARCVLVRARSELVCARLAVFGVGDGMQRARRFGQRRRRLQRGRSGHGCATRAVDCIDRYWTGTGRSPAAASRSG